MELHTKDDLVTDKIYLNDKGSYIACSECNNKGCELVQFYMDMICEKCLIKAVLMVRPISFPKNIISPLSLITHEEYKRLIDLNRPTIARQVLQNYDAFIEWLSPFLESK